MMDGGGLHSVKKLNALPSYGVDKTKIKLGGCEKQKQKQKKQKEWLNNGSIHAFVDAG